MKDILLCIDVVVKTLIFEISRCYLADYVKVIVLKCVPHVQYGYFYSFANQVIVFWRCLSSLLCVVLTSAGALNDRRDIAVEWYERLDMHTLQLGVYKWCGSLEGLCSWHFSRIRYNVT